jgi:hypothetical protein
MDKFSGTTLIPPEGGKVDDHNKAFLDILSKVNVLSNDTDSAIAGNTSSIDSLTSQLALIKDYVVDYGGTNDYQWEKWNGGKLFIRGWSYVTGNNTQQTAETAYDLPVTLADYTLTDIYATILGFKNGSNPTLRTDVGGQVANEWIVIRLTSNTRFYARGLSTTNMSASNRYPYSWQVIGKWK